MSKTPQNRTTPAIWSAVTRGWTPIDAAYAGLVTTTGHLRRDLRARRVAREDQPLGVDAELVGVLGEERERVEDLQHGVG